MEHEYRITLTMKKNSRTGRGKLTPKQALRKNLTTEFTYVAGDGAVIDVTSGRGAELDIFFTPSLLNSDKHRLIKSCDDLIEFIEDEYSLKVKVEYAGVNRDNPESVLRAFDQSESENKELEDRLSESEKERIESCKSYTKLTQEYQKKEDENSELKREIDDLYKKQTLEFNLEEKSRESELIGKVTTSKKQENSYLHLYVSI